ncbi:unnamed protein product, partial [Ectocarpus sp. 13 AM-2016]
MVSMSGYHFLEHSLGRCSPVRQPSFSPYSNLAFTVHNKLAL